MPTEFITRLQEVCGTDNMAEISRLTDIPYNTIKNYVGGRMPSAEVLVQIRKTTNVNLNWLLTGDGEMFLEKETTENKLSSSIPTAIFIEIPATRLRVSLIEATHRDKAVGVSDEEDTELIPLYKAEREVPNSTLGAHPFEMKELKDD